MALKKLSPKQVAVSAHTLAICSYMMIEHLDNVMEHPESKEIKQSLDMIMRLCETISKDVFDVKEVKSTTYIQEMCNKIDTVIRKNANFIV